jgi:hypothetical protein
VILTQPQDERRDRLANLAYLRRLADFTRREAAVRVSVLALALPLALVSSSRSLAVLVCLPALVGIVLNLTASAVVGGATTQHPLVGWYEEHLARTEGSPRLNLPAFVESVGAVCLAIVPAWVTTDLPQPVRLLLLGLAAANLCSVSGSIFDDNAWYNPLVRAPRWQEVDRIVSGPQVSLVIVASAWFAPWPAPSIARTGVVIVSLWGLLVSLRITSSQHLTRDLAPLVEHERQFGTRFVITETTRALTPPLLEAGRIAVALGPDAARVAALASDAVARINDIPAQVARSAWSRSDVPLATVSERLSTLASAAGAALEVQFPARLRLVEDDRRLAGQAMLDLTGNAITAGAAQIVLTLQQLGDRLMVIVTDNGRPMPPGAWKSAGTSSAALEQRVSARHGYLTVDQAAGSKTVTASWVVGS